MKAAVLRELGKSLEIEELDLPQLGVGHVLVRMQQAGVCHSQKLEVSGGRGPDKNLPHLIGHEGVGIVEDVGPGVTKVVAGDQVVLSWLRGTGQASAPIVYTSKSGKVNAGPIATFCERPIIAEACVTPIHPAVDPSRAVLAGCALPTGAGTVWNSAPQIREKAAICILGAGGVGLSAVAGAVFEKWHLIAVADLRETRLQRARELGATHTYCVSSSADLVQELLKFTEGRGYDLVVECAGSAKTMEAALKLPRTKFGYAVIAGNLEAGRTIQVDPFDLIRGRWLGGSWGGEIKPDTDIPKIVQWTCEGRIQHEPLLGKSFSLEQVNEAILALVGDDPGRPVIQF